MAGLKMREGEMVCTERDDCDHNNNGRHGQPDGDTAAMFRPEIIEQPEDEDDSDCDERRKPAWHTKISYARPPAQRRRHDKIRDQQERTNGGEEATLFACGGINAPSIREMGANNDVVESNDARQRADGE